MLQSQNLSDSMPFIYDSNLTATWPSQLNAMHLRLKSHSHKTFLTQNHWISHQVLQSQELSDSMPLIYESNLTQDLPNSTPYIYDSNAKDTGPSRLKANHLQKKTQSQKNFHCQEFLKSQNTTVINTLCVRLKNPDTRGQSDFVSNFSRPKMSQTLVAIRCQKGDAPNVSPESLKSQNTVVISTFCVRLKIQILVGWAIMSQVSLVPKWARL